jgi:hypothetical protein
MKAGNSAWFDGDLSDTHLALRKVIQSLLAKREARQRFRLHSLVLRGSLLGKGRAQSAADH